MSVRKSKVTPDDVSDRFPKVTDREQPSPIAPLDDHDPEDKYGSFEGHIGGEPRKGGRSGGVVGQTRQRTGTAQSNKTPRTVGRAARRKSEK